MHRFKFILTFLSIMVMGVSCTSAPQEKEEPDQLLGRPPSRTEDPFAVRIRPAQAIEAPTAGTIDAVVEPEPLIEVPEQPTQARVKPAAPVEEPTPKKALETTDGRVHCFSCVRICRQDLSDQACEATQKDVICGWGAAQGAQDAKLVATAQCDNALDMAREMPRWSEISGACPLATCR